MVDRNVVIWTGFYDGRLDALRLVNLHVGVQPENWLGTDSKNWEREETWVEHGLLASALAKRSNDYRAFPQNRPLSTN